MSHHASRGTDAPHEWQFAFGEVRHTRLRPARHAFRVRSFFVRVPARDLDGRARGNWLFGVNRAALISLRGADHGDGNGSGTWIRELLRGGGVDADGEIWLHAFPRVFGYAFKPVSFWFCHDRAGALRAVVAEVNNTFGERHCYLLTEPDGRALRQGVELSAAKAMHVSPFCGVEGRYRFRFFSNGARTVARIDYDDGAAPLLETSISGRFAAAGTGSVARALFAYPLFTFGVVARIHWHALRLWLKRVRWHEKPAPPSVPTTRGST